jgi:uncharacterized protein (TIGR03435 family)
MLLHKQHLIRAAVLALFSAAGGAAQPAFEVASVRPSATEGGRFTLTGGPGTDDPARIRFTNVPLRIVLLRAYDYRNYQIMGPDWLNTLRYDITAKLPDGTSQAEFQIMLRRLLITRFQMSSHVESKGLPIYALIAAKGGIKLKPVAKDAAAQPPEGELAAVRPGEGKDGFPEVSLRSPGIVIETRNGQARVTAREVPMTKLADFLTGQAGRPVIDKTGLSGNYTFVLYFTPPGAAADGSEPDIFTAIQEQLGLRMEASRAPVERLMIDRMEKVPAEN